MLGVTKVVKRFHIPNLENPPSGGFLFNLTRAKHQLYNDCMKKVFMFFVLITVLIVSGCGVKSELTRPDGSFPRDYPIY